MRNTYDFKFGSYWLSELGGKMQRSPDIELAQRDISFIEVPGKDGDDIIDNGRYPNVEMQRSVAFLTGNGFSADEKVNEAIQKYAYLQGYQDFEDTDHPNLITKAVLKNFDSVNKSLRTYKTADLVFSRQPFWYRKDGLKEQQILGSPSGIASLINPYPITCKPTIRFYFDYPHTTFSDASFDFYILTTINGIAKRYDININNIKVNAEYYICEMDLERQRMVLQTYQGDIREFIEMDIPKELGTGNIYFNLLRSNKLDKICVVPKWRCL